MAGKPAEVARGGNSSRAAFRDLVARFEALASEKQGLMDDMTEVIGEVKEAGFNVKAFRKLIAERKRSEAERLAEERVLEEYREMLE